jgi:SulP family sulfate permease
MKKHLPFLRWFSNYDKHLLKKDALAGITVGVVLVPQGIAYAMIAGLPPIYGLYTALIPQLVYAFLGTSPKVAVGPVAMDSLLVAAAIASLAVSSTQDVIALALLLAFLVGVIQVLMGIFKLGFVVNFLSKPVISGFTSAAAIIIGVNQFRNFFGLFIPQSNRIQDLIWYFFQHLSEIHMPTFALGLGAIFLIFLLKKIHKNTPSPLIVVVFGVLLLKYFGRGFEAVSIVEEIPSGLPTFGPPTFDFLGTPELFPIALTLAIIGFLETVSIGKSMQNNAAVVQTDPNQELIAIGFGNVLGSFFKAYPSTASFSRSAVNKSAGAQTGMAAFFSVAVVVLVLLFLTPGFLLFAQNHFGSHHSCIRAEFD